jgi:hypothetical protein
MKKKDLVIIACGGRDYTDADFVNATLSKLSRLTNIIVGGACGADTLAETWAKQQNWTNQRQITIQKINADWKTHGKKAGYIRNSEMLNELLKYRDIGKDVGVVAFPGGTGTEMMITLARKSDVGVWQPE